MKIRYWLVIVVSISAAITTTWLVDSWWLAESGHWEIQRDGRSRLVYASGDPEIHAWFLAPYVGLSLLAWLCRNRPRAVWAILVLTVILAATGLRMIWEDVSGPPVSSGNHAKGALSLGVALAQNVILAIAYLVYGASWLGRRIGLSNRKRTRSEPRV
jgi:hypothetical protein